MSVDSRIKLNPNWIVTAQGAHSLARDLDGLEAHGHDPAEVSQVGRHFTSDTTFRDRSPAFRADLDLFRALTCDSSRTRRTYDGAQRMERSSASVQVDLDDGMTRDRCRTGRSIPRSQ